MTVHWPNGFKVLKQKTFFKVLASLIFLAMNFLTASPAFADPPYYKHPAHYNDNTQKAPFFCVPAGPPTFIKTKEACAFEEALYNAGFVCGYTGCLDYFINHPRSEKDCENLDNVVRNSGTLVYSDPTRMFAQCLVNIAGLLDTAISKTNKSKALDSLCKEARSKQDVGLLLEGKCIEPNDKDWRDKDGKTLVHRYIEKTADDQSGYSHERLEALIYLVGDVNIKDSFGNTPLFYADKAGTYELEKKDAKWNARNLRMETPLIYWARKYHDAKIYGSFFQEYILKNMVKKGLDINAQDVDGKTAMHYLFSNPALPARATEVHQMKALIAAGADPKIVDKQGISPEMLSGLGAKH